ncbi:MAG: VOC family protein [Gemmatimonadetes bacterium]|nr:VOC family protein [Gemmatimonadota bacterium]
MAHFTIAVTDTERSTKFYEEVLGLKVLRANHERGMVFLDSAGDCIVLMRTETTIAPTMQRDAHHAFIVDGDKYEAAVQELKDKGIEIIERITGAPPKGYRSPSWELSEHSLSLLAERGFVYDSSLMGDDVPARRKFIESHADQVVNLDV